MQSSLDESLHSYIARQRSERAVLYMQMDDRPIAEIAEMVGYESSQSFGKAFKKHFGISPRGYMTQLRERLQSHTNECLSSHESPPPSVVSEEDDLNLVYIRILGKYGEEEPIALRGTNSFLFSRKRNLFRHTQDLLVSVLMTQT
nr:helix-turn-helix transcriptional regulator [Porphyromonas cangingivalis]